MESESNRLTHFPMRDLYLYTFQNIMIYWEKLREGWRQRAVWSITTTAASPTGISVMDGIGYRDISDRSSRWFLLSWEHNVVVLLCLQKNELLHTNQTLLVDKTLALLKWRFVRLSMSVCVSKPFIWMRWSFGVSCSRLVWFVKAERWMKGQGVVTRGG